MKLPQSPYCSSSALEQASPSPPKFDSFQDLPLILATMLFSRQTLLGIAFPILQMVNATPTPQESEVLAGLKIIDQYQSSNDNSTITW
jgi:hypothetical protein